MTLKNGKLFVIESVIVCAWVYLFRQAAVPGVRFPGLLLPKNLNMEELKYEKIIFIKKRQNELLCMPV